MTEKRLILIIDDDDLLRRTMVDGLVQSGYDVKDARSGREGLEVAFNSHPDLIFLDYQMPEMDGLEVLKALRADEWGQKVEVIFATNIYDPVAVNTSIEYGVHDYVLKADTSLEQLLGLAQKYITS